MRLVQSDGGRAAAGYRGAANDCACRAIATAAGLPYQRVYDGINAVAQAERGKGRKSSARGGVYKSTMRHYLQALGWQWVPTVGIGTGCRVHLCDGELPAGRLVVALSKHYTAVIDGVVHDTHDPARTSASRTPRGACSRVVPYTTRGTL